jgi:hypothetical protein
MQTRPPLRELGLNSGKKAGLRRILFDHGLRNGTPYVKPAYRAEFTSQQNRCASSSRYARSSRHPGK